MYIFWVRVYPRATLTAPSFGASAPLIFIQTELKSRKSKCDFWAKFGITSTFNANFA